MSDLYCGYAVWVSIEEHIYKVVHHLRRDSLFKDEVLPKTSLATSHNIRWLIGVRKFLPH